MSLRWLIMITLLFSTPAWTAEIYTFGKRGDGTRYIKKIDRPQKKTEASAENTPVKSPATPRVQQPFRRQTSPLPPPLPDAQKLDLLDRPI